MPTIKVRKQANGNTRYTAIVRIRRGGAILYRESRTFAHRSAALSWAKHRKVVLEDPSALTRVQHAAPTLAELIRWYIDTFETISKWQRSKQAHLELLELISQCVIARGQSSATQWRARDFGPGAP